MATYNRTYAGESLEDLTMSFSLVERSVYGSSRIANYVDSVQLVSLDETVSEDFVYYDSPDILSHTNGFKHFELTNHLGNVMAVVSDKRTPIITGSEITGYTPELLIAKDYYPFGMEMSGRYIGAGNEDPMNEYRFGFGGQEKDDEITGQTGSVYTAMFWEYDARIGRRWNVDPMADQRSWVSPYSYCQNNPVMRVDPTGALDDDYKLIKRTGEIKLIRKTTDDFDRIFAQKGSKYDMNNPLILKKGILGKNPSGNILGHAYFSNNNGELDKMYKFVASNSDVEWGFASFKGNNKNLSVLTTSHKYTSVSANPYKRILEDNPDFIMTQKSHSHPLNEITMQRGYDVIIPSGFNKNGSPNTNATKGDRSTYQSFENNFESRIPYSFELFVPSQPDLNIEYNNSQMFKSALITP